MTSRSKRFLIPFTCIMVGLAMGIYIASDLGLVRFGFGSDKNVTLGSSGEIPAELLQLQNTSKAFVMVAKTVGPVVVTISSERVIRSAQQNQGDSPGSPFEDFFGQDFFDRFFRFQVPEGEMRQQGLGSGVIVSEDGYILTNNHVVSGADKIRVTMADEKKYDAKVIGTDPKTDVAVIRIEADGLPVARFGDSGKLEVGEWVLAIGSPLSERLEQTVTAGIVSAKGRSNVGLAEFEDFIQTDAAINPGNSGGPLVNLRGEVVGINTAILSRSGGYQGIGFAIPIEMARKVMEDLVEKGKVVRGWMGVVIQNVDDDMADALGIGKARGVVISEVAKGGPAEKAGLRQGDVILQFEGKKVATTVELRNLVVETPPETDVDVTILRDGKEKKVRVELGELAAEELAAAEEPRERVESEIGLEVQTLTSSMASRLNMEGEEGVIVTKVKSGSPAEAAGIQHGDLIKEVNKQKVTDTTEYRKALGRLKPGDSVLLLLRRENATLFVALRMPK
ncbi:MAG: DegQ family serine endoprotease [Candidatus Eisenbacteria bacterium]|nr:DegQ family serine endoprotease [Candidatus Eisenbacteria bacterium]